MRRLMWLAFLSFLIIAITGCGPKMVSVATGEKVVCSLCGKVIKSDIRTLQVKESDVSRYSVRERTGVCAACQAKIEAKRREEERRRAIEEARVARQRMAEEKGRIIGTWIKRTGMGDIIISLHTDKTGQISVLGQAANFHWQYQGSNGFTAIVTDRGNSARLFGYLASPSGNQMLSNAMDWGTTAGTVLDRLH